jgi:hypothetical protein
VCALAGTVLAWAGGGPAGPGRLAQVGPQPLLTGAALGLEVALGAVLTVLVAVAGPSVPRPARRLPGSAGWSRLRRWLRLPPIRLPRWLRLPRVRLPRVRLPRVRLPRVRLPRVRLPRVRLPRVRLPRLRRRSGRDADA